MESRSTPKRIIPYGRHCLDHDDMKSVGKTLSSDWLTQGPVGVKFEERLAKYCGARYALTASSGTSALHLAYLSAGIGKGDEVITTPNTFVATTNMLLVVGAKPVFCDIRLDTYNIDETKIEALITKKTKAIVPVHFAGHPCNMKEIMAIAKKYHLLVIEDACHALGATYRGKHVGSIGDITVFSFHPVKSITTGEGGAIVTGNKKYAEKARLLRSHGITKDKNGFNVMESLGFNYRLTDIQSSLGVSQLGKLKGFITKRRKTAFLYRKLLERNQDIILPAEEGEDQFAWHLFVIRVRNVKERLPLYHFLKNNGIGVNFHYPTVYSHPYYRKNGYDTVHLMNADLYNEAAITLPIFPSISEKDVIFITDSIKKYFKAR